MKARKGYGLLVIAIAVFAAVAAITFGVSKLTAATPYGGMYLTNVATLSWSSGSVVATNTRIVGTNYGGIWTGEANQNVVAGNIATNSTVISNMGNASTVYVLTNFIKRDFAAQAWTTGFRNMSDMQAWGSSISVTISAFGFKNVDFYVEVPATETNGSYIDYMCRATNRYASALGATRYTGSNAIVYGGQMGMLGAPVGGFWLAQSAAYATTNWVLTVQAPTLTLTKSIDAVAQPGVYTGTQPVPGSRITYKLVYVNSSALSATSVRIIDRIPLTYVAYVASSMKHDGNTAATWATASQSPTDAADGDQGAYTNTDRIFFAPNGNAITGNGTLAASEDGAYFYRVDVR